MDEYTIHIEDHTSLIALNKAIDHCGDSLLKILEDVNKYLDGAKRNLEQQKDILYKQLEEAQEAERQAQYALSDCENSRYWDEKDQCYRPSCRMERDNYDAAQEHRRECQDKYDRACRIVSTAEYELSEYHKTGGIIIPPGPEKRLEYLAKGHTDEATRKLSDIIADVEDYLEIPHEEIDENEALPSDKQEKFKKAADKIRAMQQSEAHYNHIAEANVAMICPRCGQPFTKCICARLRERQYS